MKVKDILSVTDNQGIKIVNNVDNEVVFEYSRKNNVSGYEEFSVIELVNGSNGLIIVINDYQI